MNDKINGEEFKIKDLIIFLEAEEEKAMRVLGKDKNFKELGQKRARAFWHIRQLIQKPEIDTPVMQSLDALYKGCNSKDYDKHYLFVKHSLLAPEQKPKIDDMEKYVIDKACEAVRFYDVVCQTVEDSRNFIRQILKETQGMKPKIDEKYVEEKANDIADTIIDYLPNGQYEDMPIELNKLREFITKIIRDAQIGISKDWLPTAENINGLPDPIRKYIADLETNADPAGMIQENMFLRATVEQLKAKLMQVPVVKIKKKGNE